MNFTGIMTKSKNGNVARSIADLATNTLPVVVIQSVFPLLPLGRYQTRDSNAIFIFTTIDLSRNVPIVKYGVSLVTIIFLDFVSVNSVKAMQRKLKCGRTLN